MGNFLGKTRHPQQLKNNALHYYETESLYMKGKRINGSEDSCNASSIQLLPKKEY